MANVFVSRSNRTGIPLLLAQSVSTTGTDTTFSFNNHVNINDDFTGLFLVKMPMIVDETTSNNVYFSTIGISGSAQVYANNGIAATVSDVASSAAPTYHLFLYDRVSNKLQIMI